MDTSALRLEVLIRSRVGVVDVCGLVGCTGTFVYVRTDVCTCGWVGLSLIALLCFAVRCGAVRACVRVHVYVCVCVCVPLAGPRPTIAKHEDSRLGLRTRLHSK